MNAGALAAAFGAITIIAFFVFTIAAACKAIKEAREEQKGQEIS